MVGDSSGSHCMAATVEVRVVSMKEQLFFGRSTHRWDHVDRSKTIPRREVDQVVDEVRFRRDLWKAGKISRIDPRCGGNDDDNYFETVLLGQLSDCGE